MNYYHKGRCIQGLNEHNKHSWSKFEIYNLLVKMPMEEK
jgi:hypothetical protein